MSGENKRFSGKVALVTGSSRGIGQAIALQLAMEGADVLVNYRKRAKKAEDTVARIRAIGRRSLPVKADVGDPNAITQMFELLVEEFGGLDFLISNAAGGMQSPLREATMKAWDLAMNVNARGYLLCAQAAYPLLKARGGGRIIALTARIATERAFPGYGTVAASKAAIGALTAYLAVEFGPDNIIVNAVSPGVIDTEALAHFPSGTDMLMQGQERTPSGRITEVEDVAHLVAFLCSDEAHQINGQIIEIDGGNGRLFT